MNSGASFSTETDKIMPPFIPGLLLAERFYREAVRPILDAEFPGLPHAAGLIGSGSEVLGFDTPVSCDHHWGPRVQLFLSEHDHPRNAQSMRDRLSQYLPQSFLGWPTSFTQPNSEDHGVQLLVATSSGPINHRVEVLTPRKFFLDYLDFDLCNELSHLDWLTFPSQKLRTVRAGAVFHDAVGLNEILERFVWYPRDNGSTNWRQAGSELARRSTLWAVPGKSETRSARR